VEGAFHSAGSSEGLEIRSAPLGGLWLATGKRIGREALAAAGPAGGKDDSGSACSSDGIARGSGPGSQRQIRMTTGEIAEGGSVGGTEDGGEEELSTGTEGARGNATWSWSSAAITSRAMCLENATTEKRERRIKTMSRIDVMRPWLTTPNFVRKDRKE